MYWSIPPRYHYGQENYAYWENFLSNETIDKILARPEWINSYAAKVGSQNGEGIVNKELRRTDIAWLGFDNETRPLWETLGNVVSEVNRRFFHFDLTGCYEAMQLGIYKAGDNGHYGWHTDAYNNDGSPRKLSMSLILSDPSEYEGGELQIKTDSDEIKTLPCPRGRAWFFPSYVLHRVTPVTKGVRRSLVLWVGGPPFK
jgi:PKHD-type hydroxylase